MRCKKLSVISDSAPHPMIRDRLRARSAPASEQRWQIVTRWSLARPSLNGTARPTKYWRRLRMPRRDGATMVARSGSRVQLCAPIDFEDWNRRFASGLVADRLPYGFDQLERPEVGVHTK